MSDALQKQSVNDLDGYPYAPRACIGTGQVGELQPPVWRELVQQPPIAEIVLCALCCLFNLSWVWVIASVHSPMPGPPPTIGVFFGILGGQLGALSTWFVWSQRSFAIRLPVYCILLYVLLAFLLAGLWIGEPASPDTFARGAAYGLPLVSLAIHLPLWLLRCYFGWEIIASANQKNGSQPRQALSIADIVVGTALAAVAVSAARFTSNEPTYPRAHDWQGWCAAVGIIAGISLASLPPIVFCTLWFRRVQTGLWILSGYTLIAIITFVLIAGRIFRPRSISAEEVVELGGLVVALAGGTLVPLLVARFRGLRLRIA
jgi:hypothetical protein